MTTTMSSIPNPSAERLAEASEARLDAHLLAAAKRELRSQRNICLLQGCWLWLCVLLAAVMYDALWQLQHTGRLIAAGGLVVLAVVLVLRAMFGRKAGQPKFAKDDGATRTRPRALWHAAAAIEAHHGLHDNPLVNALWLSQQNRIQTGRDDASAAGSTDTSASQSSLTAALRERSIVHAANTAALADPDSGADDSALAFHRARLLLILGLWLVLLLLMPRLITTGLQRLANPWSDRPAFSLTRFEVTLPSEPVAQGSDVLVEITLHGQQPDTLDWVDLGPANQNRNSDAAAMVSQGQAKAIRRWRLEPLAPGKYQRRLRRFNQNITFELQAGNAAGEVQGTSHRMTIKVLPLVSHEPEAKDAARDSNPSEPETASTNPATQPSQSDDPSSTSQNPIVQDAAAAQQQLATLAEKLADTAQLFATQLQTDAANPPDAAQTQAIASQLEAFKRMHQEMQAKLKAEDTPTSKPASGSDNDASARDQALLQQMAMTLEGLRTPSINAPASSSGDNSLEMATYMNQLAAAARSDQQALSMPSVSTGTTAGSSDQASGQTAAGGDENAKDPSSPTDVLRQGVYHQQDTRQSTTLTTTTARSRAVPEIYRPMVQQYFDRLNQDQSKPTQANPVGANP